MAKLRLALLGGFEARLDSGPPVAFPRRKALALLAYLALGAGQTQPRDKLAALLWGDVPDRQARQSLRQALVTLRALLAQTTPPGLVETGDGVGLDAAAIDLDVTRFERLVTDASPESLEAAADLYRGDLLAGLPIEEASLEEWLVVERERLRELAIEALARLLAHRTRTGAVQEAVRTAGRLLALDPTQEPVHRTVMRLYGRQGRRGAALRQYQVCCDALQRELGAEPESETRRLYEELLRAPSVPVTEAVGALAAAERVALPTPTTALVGRAAEQRRLVAACRGAWQGLSGKVALVLGEAGIGKTRLVEAVVAEAGGAPAVVLVGHAHESEQVLPFGPWIEALRDNGIVAALEEAADPAWLASPWRVELGRLFPELGPTDRPPTAGEDYVRLFEAIAHLLGRGAALTPLLVVLEDLHWADEMSLRLLAFLSRRGAGWPLMLLATARDEEIAGNTRLGQVVDELERADHLTRVVIAPLDEADTRQLVRILARSGTAAAALDDLERRVWTASEGHPFVVIEIMRSLREGQGGGDGRLALPDRVRRLVAGRLSRLTPEARELAALGAVIGREFEFALLVAAAGREPAEVARGVEDLVARRIFHVVDERLDFAHDRIRDVAYADLLPATRRFHHQVVAGAIETLYASDLDRHSLALGHHYRACENWGRAFGCLRRAGAIASRRAAHRAAVACLEQALEALGRLPASPETSIQAIDVRFEIRQSCTPLADPTRILAHLDAAARAAAALPDRWRLAWADAFRTHAEFLAGEFSRARAAGQRALAIAAELDDPGLRLSTNVYLGQVYERVGDYEAAAACLRENVEVLEQEVERRGDIDALGVYSRVFGLARGGAAARQGVYSRTYLAWCLAELGAFAQAIAAGEEAMRLAEAHDSPYEQAHACLGLGSALLRRGDFERAGQVAQRGVELCEGRDFPLMGLVNAAILGSAEAQTARPDRGVPRLEQATAMAGPHAGPFGTMLGEAYLLAGRREDARVAAERALAWTAARGERGWNAWARYLSARVAAAEGPAGWAPAAKRFREALEHAASLGMAPLVAHCRAGLGALHLEAGRERDGRAELAAAVEAYRALAMPSWLARAEAALARGPARG